jgi:hypothetical protein
MQDRDVLIEFMRVKMPSTLMASILDNHNAIEQFTKLQNDCFNFGVEKGKAARL